MTSRPRRVRRGSAWLVLPVGLLIVGAPEFLQQPFRAFDDGLYLTLARFTGFEYLPYRDLWTLYGPGPSLFAAVLDTLAGPGLMTARLGLIGIQGALVTGIYALSARFVSRWVAAGLAAVVATFGYLHNHYHFGMALAFVAWGLWFVDRGRIERNSRRITIGLGLIGACFLGRYELAPIAALGVITLWWALLPSIREDRWLPLVTGLLPVALFGAYLLLIVGWERAQENLLSYPLRYYALPGCRGTPSAWPFAADALLAPLGGRLWTGRELTLWMGTYVPPVTAMALGVVAIRRRNRAAAPLLIAIALVCVLVWVEQRPRAGMEPHPVWPFLLISFAALLSRIRTAWHRDVTAGLVLGLVACVAATSWLPGALRAWMDWPARHPVYGYANAETSGLLDKAAWDRIRVEVQRRVPPGDEIFIALTDNTGTFANLPVFYWLTDRAPASRFFEFDPCLTDRADIQHRIVADLRDVELVIVAPYFTSPPPPVGGPTEVLDRYLAASFRPVHHESLLGPGDVAILVRAGDRSATAGHPVDDALDSTSMLAEDPGL